MSTLCLGEALVDLICEHPVADLGEAGAFVPHFGGAAANVAVAAARHGARIALAGGAGDDPWGHWLRDRLAGEGIALEWFELRPGHATPVAFVTVDAAGEAGYRIYGDGIAATIEALGDRVLGAVTAAEGLFITSNTLVGERERELTMAARARALELERPVVFDPNLRLHRWRSRADARSRACACVAGSLLVRANRPEAELMTGEADPERAARALVKAGARMAVVSLGAEGAILRGELRADAPGAPARALSTVGAGDVLTGLLLARLALSGFYPPAVAAALPDAVAAAAEATERWGALE